MLLHLFKRLLSLLLNQFSSEIYRRLPGLLLLQHLLRYLLSITRPPVLLQLRHLLQCLLSLPHSRLQLSLQLEQYHIKICRRTSVLLLLLHLFQQSVATVLASVKVPAVATKVTPTTFYAAETVPYQDLSQTFSAAPASAPAPAVANKS